MGKRIYKSPELIKAKRKLISFIKDNNLNPSKDYSNHPKYGKEFKGLLLSLTIERQKIEKVYPQLDRKNQIKHIKSIMAKKEKISSRKKAEKTLKGEGDVKITKKEVKKAEKTPHKMKYDYPLVNGKEMSPDQKKKYRIEQRKLAKGDTPKSKKVEATDKPKKVKKEIKKDKTPKSEKKVKTEKVKKVKKVKKVED